MTSARLDDGAKPRRCPEGIGYTQRAVTAGTERAGARRVQSIGMVQRYSHLSPGHLADALEKLVDPLAASAPGAVELGPNLDSSETARLERP